MGEWLRRNSDSLEGSKPPLFFLPCLPVCLPPPLPPPNRASAVNKQANAVLQTVLDLVRVARAVQSAAYNSLCRCPLWHTALAVLK